MNFTDYVYQEYLFSKPNFKVRNGIDETIAIKNKLQNCVTGEQFALFKQYDKALHNLHSNEIKFVINLVAKMYKSIYK